MDELNYTQMYLDQAKVSDMYLIMVGISILLLVALGYMLYKSRKEANKKQSTFTTEVKEYIEKLKELEQSRKEGTLKIKEIKIDDMPTELKEEFLKQSGIYKVFNETPKPMMMLLLNTGEIQIKGGIKEGQLPLTTPDGKLKWIDINPGKLHQLCFADKKIPCYIGFEDEAELYPHQVKHYSRSFYNIVEALQLNKGNLATQGGRFPRWLIFVGIGVVLIVGGYFAFGGSFGGGAKEAVQNVTTTVVQNVTTGATPVPM